MSLSVIDYTVQLVWGYRLNQSNVIRGGFRGGRAGHAPPLKFAKHMLCNFN